MSHSNGNILRQRLAEFQARLKEKNDEINRAQKKIATANRKRNLPIYKAETEAALARGYVALKDKFNKAMEDSASGAFPIENRLHRIDLTSGAQLTTREIRALPSFKKVERFAKKENVELSLETNTVFPLSAKIVFVRPYKPANG